MKQRDTEHGVQFTTDTGLVIDIVLIGEVDGAQYLAVSTPHRRVDMRISPKGHAIKHWTVKAPLTSGLVQWKAAISPSTRPDPGP